MLSMKMRWMITVLLAGMAGCVTQERPSEPVQTAAPPAAPTPPPVTHEATLTRTQYGVAHVTAQNWDGLGYGYGYAVAQDTLCVLADALVTFRGERSLYFGADGKIPGASTLRNPPNLEADFFFRHLVSDAAIARYRAAQSAQMAAVATGYAAGYSRYVREIQGGAHPGRHVACRNQPWVKEITADDVYRRMYALGMALSSINFITSIANAKPPATAEKPDDARNAALSWQGDSVTTLPWQRQDQEGFGSNMIGFGSAATGTPHGLLFGNPHWFWDSVDRFHQVHLQAPGLVDVQGASIVGVPVVLIGFNQNVAWSHTVSTAERFTLYRLDLVPGDPTAYRYDGQVRHMTSTEVAVDVKSPDGTVSKVTRTLYSSHYGPMLDMNWDGEHAITIRDVNAENFRPFRNWMRWASAKNLEDFIRIQREEVAIPWVNTVAAGRNDSRTWYADVGAIPNISDAKRKACTVAKMTFDGSRSACEWDNTPGTPQPGILPADKLPQLLREDYVENSNDSYWLSNVKAPLTGFPRVIGPERDEQSLRTRLGHILVRQRLAGSDGLPGKLATSENIRQIVLNSRSLGAELFLDDVLNSVCKRDSITLAGKPAQKVDVRQACAVLAKWDRKGNPDSVGSLLWDQIWNGVEKIPSEQRYKVKFDPAAPLDTPRGLKAGDPRVAQAFAAGVLTVQQSSIPLDAPDSAYQYFTDAAGQHIPMAGGCGNSGSFTIMCAHLKDGKITLGPYGNSYMQIVTFTDDGVVPYTLLVPSQSTDPASPHYRDYTRAYSQKQWLRVPFTAEEVKTATVESIQLRE